MYRPRWQQFQTFDATKLRYYKRLPVQGPREIRIQPVIPRLWPRIALRIEEIEIAGKCFVRKAVLDVRSTIDSIISRSGVPDESTLNASEPGRLTALEHGTVPFSSVSPISSCMSQHDDRPVTCTSTGPFITRKTARIDPPAKLQTGVKIRSIKGVATGPPNCSGYGNPNCCGLEPL
jgi:hypothetical protein